MTENPFKPSAGSTPPLLIGRAPVLDAVAEALRDGPGAPGRITIFTGARGVGKTVMLNEVEEEAARQGWLWISETATEGLLGRLDEHVAHLVRDTSARPRRRVSGVTLPGRLGGINLEPTPELSVDLRRQVKALLDARGPAAGLLITLDEIQSGARAELRQLAALTQHLVREDRQFALVMAGLPSAVSGLLRDDVLTFLRRADKHVLGDVPIDEVQEALVATISASGRTIDPGAAQVAAEATGGYPFMVQLIGYHLWRSAHGDRVDLDAVEAGVSAARRRLGSLVHETALKDLSDVDRTFLMAMSLDEGPSRMGDLLRRLGGVAPQYGNTYKNRLIEAGMIETAGYGKVDFALPYLRDYLREHGASLGLSVPGA